MTQPDVNDFDRATAQAGNVGTLREVWEFLGANKKWWLLPILLVMGFFSLLIVLSGTGVAPIIYTLF